MKTVFCHFYNEEYLLPFWLKHHKELFDHGVMINYASTDRSVDIIKDLCPSWEILQSKNEYFLEPQISNEVYELEIKYTGWKVCLNVTEFLFGDFSLLDNSEEKKSFMAPVSIMIDNKTHRDSTEIDNSKQLYEQFTFGRELKRDTPEFYCRNIANFIRNYPAGRHFKYNINDIDFKFFILKYLFSPMTDEFLNRKLQIQNKIPYKDPQYKIFRGGGAQTFFGMGLTKKHLFRMHQDQVDIECVDISTTIQKLIEMTNKTKFLK